MIDFAYYSSFEANEIISIKMEFKSIYLSFIE